MIRTLFLSTLLFFAATASQAMTAYYGGTGSDSLHGATGSLSVTETATLGTYEVVWEIDFSTFDITGAEATGHELLTDLGFKAFSSVSSATLDSIIWDMPAPDPDSNHSGTFHLAGNISNAGCEGPSPASFVCVADIAPDVDATEGGILRATFTVTGTVMTDGWSYRGKFGEDDGWVISETGTPGNAVPEPGAALVFGLGIVVAETARRRSA